MKRDYWALWSLLALAFALFLGLSMCSAGHLSLGPFSIKTPSLAGVFRPAAGADSVAQAGLSDTVPQTPKLRRVVLDRSPKCILLIGDSMVEGLAPRLAAYCHAGGHQLHAVIWYSSTTELYGSTRLISDYIRAVHPDYIFLSLGGNELFVKDIEQKRADYVQSIIDEIGDIPYLWIGPPNWKADTGINDLICSRAAEGCFFLSDGMHFERKRDGAHPTSASSIEWMDSIVRWMPAHARYCLAFDQPDSKISRPQRYYLHQPGQLTQRPK